MSDCDTERVSRHEIDCECGRTTVSETVPQAEVHHLWHFLVQHDDQEAWEVERAKEQLEDALERCCDDELVEEIREEIDL